MRRGFVYIITNWNGRVLYTGVTSDLKKRIYQHRVGTFDGFTARYRISKLVYYESWDDIGSAIFREKQIKAGSRGRKVRLISGLNPGWIDLYSRV